MKSIDIWMIGCESLVFMSLLEFTLAQFLQRRIETVQGPSKTILKSKIKVNPKTDDKSLDKHDSNRTRRISKVIGLQSEDGNREGMKLVLFTNFRTINEVGTNNPFILRGTLG